jgi:hypothetical protein
MFSVDPEASTVARVLREVAHPDLETVMIEPVAGPNSRSGIDGFLSLWAEWTAAFEHFTVEQTEEPMVNGDVVVNFSRQRGTLPGSAAEVTADGYATWFFDAGRLARIEFHLSRDAAMRAAGIVLG